MTIAIGNELDASTGVVFSDFLTYSLLLFQPKSPTKKVVKYVVDTGAVGAEGVVSAADMLEYFQANIKVDNKKGNLGNIFTVTVDGGRVTIAATIDFSKRYIKYLTKKYLKKNVLREYVRVVATSKSAYELKYFRVGAEEEEEEEAEE